MATKGRAENYEAIVLWRKKHKNYGVYAFLTKELGIVRCSVPHRSLPRLKAAGYLQPFSHVFVTLQADGEFYNLQQLDGRHLVKSLQSDLNAICYTAFAAELTDALFRGTAGEARTLFRAVACYARALDTKPAPLATVIFGWQLLAMEGYISLRSPKEEPVPDSRFWEELQIQTGLTVTAMEQTALLKVLEYKWQKEEALSLTTQQWQRLEQMLFAYSTAILEAPMQSLLFLQSLEGKLLL